MRSRVARLSHATEMYIGTGSATGQRQSATSWPTGGRIVDVEINVNANSVQPLDSDVDYRDRWLTMTSMIRDSANMLPGLANDNLLYPHDAAAATGNVVGMLLHQPFYTGKGWSGAPRPTPVGEVFNQYLNAATAIAISVYIYADPLTGGLTLKNDTVNAFNGFIRIIAGEQLSARIVIP